MRFFDATRPLAADMQVFPGDPEIRFVMHESDASRITELHLSTHSGTHIDAPLHFLENGEPIDRLPFSSLVGPCRVLDLRHVGSRIEPEDLDGRMTGARKVLLKTWYSERREFAPGYPHLAPAAASLAVQGRIDCLGIDSPSIEAMDGGGRVHRTLLSRGVAVIEMLDLSGIAAGDYWLIALPLRLTGLDGSPARVVLARDFPGGEGMPYAAAD